MIRVVLMSDLSESYSNKLVKGMAKYSFECTPLVICKMPLSIYVSGGINKVLEFAIQWKADAIIGQFEPTDDVSLFKKHGIIVIAQDFRKRLEGVTNITAEYALEGQLAAEYLLNQGARNFGFYGLSGMVWSDERREGFISGIKGIQEGAIVSVLERSGMDDIWWYDLDKVIDWLRGLPKPVAILACDDNMAFHIVEACNQIDEPGFRIPEDVMLLGVDDDESICQLCSPTLSSLKPMIEQAGYNVAKQLDDRMKLPVEDRLNEVSDVKVMFGSIVTRESTNIFIHHNPYINKVCEYIRHHYTDNLKVEDLVALVPMSRRLLERQFRSEMRVSIHQFIIRFRVEKMVALLNHGKSPLDAANDMNQNLHLITRNFKTIMGMTPSEYSKSLLN